MKTCYICKLEKPLSEFYTHRTKKDGYMSECKVCKKQAGKEYKRQLRSTKEGHIKALYATRKCYAKKAGTPFNISLDWFIDNAPEFCPILNIKLDWGCSGKGKYSDSSPSIDKIKPELGYTEGNVAWLSYRANRIKNNATFEELKAITNWMKAYY